MTRFVLSSKSFAAAVALTASVAIWAISPAAAQQAFDTPQKAADALGAAAKSADEKAILAVLGQAGEDIVSSGDPVEDKTTLEKFNAAYDKKHLVTLENAGKAIIDVGDDDYPFPIPIVQIKGGKWVFDTAAGRQEILYRRIGRNELSTIQAALAFVDAQDEYDSKDRGDGAGVYAQKFLSTPGKKDGLYWPTAAGEEQSPLGEFAANASAEGYSRGDGPTPYHGYYYKILTKQGPAADGGAVDYVVNGKMIGGFALIAYPAEYRNSGVMSFMINYSGVLYQKDLGPDTEAIAQATTTYNPDSTWKKVDTSDEEQ